MDLSDMHIIFKLRNQLFGVQVGYVKEMVVLPETYPVPDAAPYVRGVVNLRGQVLSVVDLRKLLGFMSAQDEFSELIQMLHAREEDHRKWIQELENSIRNNVPFGLATDPHQCAFGKWYDHYMSEHLVISEMLKDFDAPHRRIHAIAAEALALQKDNRHAEAMALIDRTRQGDLQEMVRLFAGLRNMLSETRREIGVVLVEQGKQLVITADNILAVEHLSTETTHALSEILPGPNAASDCIQAVGELRGSRQLTLLLNPAQILKRI